MRIHSFDPIINKNCRMIILGSVPGIESLKKQEYYGHPRNKFWDVLYGIFSEKPDDDYGLKIDFLLAHKIALWDVIESCTRSGSSDSKIRNVKVNDFYSLFHDYPGLTHVFFNGRTAQKIFKQNFSFPSLELKYIGSTSPAHAVTMEELLCDWSSILKSII